MGTAGLSLLLEGPGKVVKSKHDAMTWPSERVWTKVWGKAKRDAQDNVYLIYSPIAVYKSIHEAPFLDYLSNIEPLTPLPFCFHQD